MQRLRLAFAVASFFVLAACNAGGASPESRDLTQHAGAAPPAASAQGPTGDSDVAAAYVELLPLGREPVRVRVELARTPEQRRVGLMHRKHLDADAGMLFLFEERQQLTFWMRNTYVPLDMIFIEPSMRVLGIVENAEPLTETSRFVPGLSQYVLEVNAGFSREHGLQAGTVVRFEGVDAEAPEEGAP